MNKKLVFAIAIIIIASVSCYIYYSKRFIAEIQWPLSAKIEHTGEKDIFITIKEPLNVYAGEWAKDTSFAIFENEIKQIEVFDDFNFFGFTFKKGALIETRVDENEKFHDIFLKSSVMIDGLDLHIECVIAFKNSVLYSARCPEFKKVFFKRFIKPSALEYAEDGPIHSGIDK